ncbi:MAG: OmpA family protein [Gemmatimonadota bacterium]|nr:OmpA family protein [Gemmatimonadota bacterium]MDH4348263.1 OmpA family protein [Gemmatimonadota bacterium]MDH5283136.1 OmpA family protein [Gemmatimonadota bacterium]
MRRIGWKALVLSLLLAAPAAAQTAGTVELGAFGRFISTDPALNFDAQPGYGARLGVFVRNNLAIEADVARNDISAESGSNVKNNPIHGRLVYGIPMGKSLAFMLGGGYTYNIFSKSYDEEKSGAGGLIGFRIGTGPGISARIDGTLDYIFSAESKDGPYPSLGVDQADDNIHLGLQVGVSVLLGKAKDSDKDKVKDSADECPDTPAGEQVDAKGCTLPKDLDGDGVMDNVDACLGTPAGDAIDTRGCSLPKDADLDGVIDAADKCPATPAGAKVDATGCQIDTDKDGVFDDKDQCPDTPLGTQVDSFGCAKDSDGDGVADGADQCPGTPAGVSVDVNGCTARLQVGQALVLEGVNFETGKATLLPESKPTLDRVAQAMIANPTTAAEVSGHTDNTGSRATNTKLSLDRANAVRDYLISKGVSGERLTTAGYGPDQPIADNATKEGKAQNRRVELKRTN